MSISSLHYADLCDYGYKEPKRDPDNPGQYLPEKIDGIDYEPLACKNNPAAGYQGTVYQRVDTGEIIVVHRGT
jgi:hypothetical protein